MWLGGTLLLLGSEHVEAGLARCWVLRRHLLGVFLVRLLAGFLTHSCGFVGVVVLVGFGVWLCVECCIVDASILLWSSV